MHRSIRSLLALPLLAMAGCTDSPNVVEIPDADTPQYGPGAGTDATPVDAEPDHPALADPGQPPDEALVPSGAGGAVDAEQEPGPFEINPPRDLEEQPPADALGPAPAPAPEPSPEGADAPSPDTPAVDEPEEPGVAQP